jgi:hypothetical protein
MHTPSKYTVPLSPTLSNISAWDLLKRILDENLQIREKFPHAVINSIITDTMEISITAPSRIEEIEKDMEDLRRRGQVVERMEDTGNTEMWIRGWRKCGTAWAPQPMGVCL